MGSCVRSSLSQEFAKVVLLNEADIPVAVSLRLATHVLLTTQYGPRNSRPDPNQITTRINALH